MNKLIKWFKTSNRWKHLLGGMLIGICANTWYCTLYAGVGVAAALELKDKMWGGKWDWIDLSLTSIGAVIGQALRTLI